MIALSFQMRYPCGPSYTAHQVRADRQLALERSQRTGRRMTGTSWFFVALAGHAREGGGSGRSG